jgi:hypothetical protein
MKQISKTVGLTLGMLALIAPQSRAGAPVPLATPAPAATTAEKTSGPKIKFDSDVFDFGKVPAGQPIKHSFIFTNIGTGTLEVTKVNPTCGCTVAGDWTKKVEPGETGTIPLQVNVNAGWNGLMQKTITVECNDKTRPPGPIPLNLKFVVWKPVDVSQQYVILNIAAEETNEVSTVVRVDNNMEEALAVYDAASSNPAFGVGIKTNDAGKHYELVVRALPPFKPGNNTSGQITAKTSAPNMASISLTAAANVSPVFNIMPAQLVLEASLTNTSQKSITIQYMGSGLSQLSNPVFSAKGVDVQLAESQPGKIYTVTLSFPPGFEAQGKPMELSLTSSSSKMPVIKVPVHQMPKPVVPVKPASAAIPATEGRPQTAVVR